MIISYSEYHLQFRDFIDQYRSFEIVGVPTSEMFDVCEVLEKYIESQHLKCRIYTQKRFVSGAIGLVNPIAGAAALIGIGIHNIITWDPDFEISRDLANNRISVEYKKK